MLKVEALTKVFKSQNEVAGGGIIDASFELAPGGFFTLLGPSGCGKTTTLRCIAGLEQPDSGAISLGARLLFDHRTKVSVPMNKRRMGMVFQSYAIWPHMTVSENVAFPLRVSKERRTSSEDIAKQVAVALQTVGLASYGDRPAVKLSGGQQQRVALARAIIGRPDLLLLDEPLSNLDAALREEMRTELKRLQMQLGMTTVYVTHDQSEALSMSDMVAVINQGKIVQLAPPKDVYFRPANEFVASFIGATNIIKAEVMGRKSLDGCLQVRMPTGELIQVTYLGETAGRQHINFSLRPESITISPQKAKDVDGDNILRGHITRMSFLGSEVHYDVRLGECIVRTTTRPDTIMESGQEVRLSFPSSAAIGLN